MTTKIKYEVGDDAWLHGVSRYPNKLIKGRIIRVLDFSDRGYEDEHYVIEIPTHIEPLLEIRSWHSLSQDEQGPIGLYRHMGDHDTTLRYLSKVGMDTAQLTTEAAEPVAKNAKNRGRSRRR